MSSDRDRTKVAVIIGSLDRGGAEQDIVRVFPRLDPDEFEVVVIAFSSPGTLAPIIERAGIRVVSRHIQRPEKTGPWIVRRTRDSLYALGLIPWIARTMRAESVDIAHFFLPYSYGYGMLACALMSRKPKRVMSRLSFNFYRHTNRMLSWLERTWFHRSVDIAIGNSLPILEELSAEGVPTGRLRLVRNGIDSTDYLRDDTSRNAARQRLGIQPEAYVMLAVGNLHGYKGHRDLLEACAAARGGLPEPWQMLIVGRDEADNLAAYETLAAEHGIASRVALLGERDDVKDFLLAADIFVHPSHHEGMPNAILEAMAASLPIVATSVGGVPDAVVVEPEQEATGWLVDAQDPVQLASVLIEAASDENRRAQRGKAAHRRVESLFSVEACASAYGSIYSQLARSESFE